MANEARVNASLIIRKGSVDYASRPSAFQATVNADPASGPTPGLILAPPAGVNVDLSKLTHPGLCRYMNLLDPAESSNYVEIGVWIPGTLEFVPFGEALPGETYVVRLSRFIGHEIGTGAGTAPGPATMLRVKGIGGTVPVIVEAFEA